VNAIQSRQAMCRRVEQRAQDLRPRKLEVAIEFRLRAPLFLFNRS
jgi:hypothetical protein